MKMQLKKNREVSGSLMIDVIVAIFPAVLAGIIFFGPRAILMILASVISAGVAEYLYCKIAKKENSLFDLSFVVTGILIALNVSSLAPVYAVCLASAVSIVLVKMIFGGVEKNILNPSAFGVVILMALCFKGMNNWADPFQWFTKCDTLPAPPPLIAEDVAFTPMQLLFGLHKGNIGETSIVLLLIGGIYLVIRKVITPIIPLSFMGTVVIFSFILGANPITAILSGNVVLCAIFMATEYSTSPSKPMMQLGFGLGCGILTSIFRYLGIIFQAAPLAILIMNILFFIGKFIYDKYKSKQKEIIEE